MHPCADSCHRRVDIEYECLNNALAEGARRSTRRCFVGRSGLRWGRDKAASDPHVLPPMITGALPTCHSSLASGVRTSELSGIIIMTRSLRHNLRHNNHYSCRLTQYRWLHSLRLNESVNNLRQLTAWVGNDNIIFMATFRNRKSACICDILDKTLAY